MTTMFKEQCPSQKVPDAETCKQISDVFFKFAEALGGIGHACDPSHSTRPAGWTIDDTSTTPSQNLHSSWMCRTY